MPPPAEITESAGDSAPCSVSKCLSIGWGIEHQKSGSLHAHVVGLQKIAANDSRIFSKGDIKTFWDKQFLAELEKVNPEAYQWIKGFGKKSNAHVATARKNVAAYVMKYAYKKGTIPPGGIKLKQYWGVTDEVRSQMRMNEYSGIFSWCRETFALLVEVLTASGMVGSPFFAHSADGVLRCITMQVLTKNVGLILNFIRLTFANGCFNSRTQARMKSSTLPLPSLGLPET